MGIAFGGVRSGRTCPFKHVVIIHNLYLAADVQKSAPLLSLRTAQPCVRRLVPATLDDRRPGGAAPRAAGGW